MTPYPHTTIRLRRRGQRALTLRVLSQLPGYVVARDTPHKPGAFCPVLILDLATEENGTFRTAQGSSIYPTEHTAIEAATGLVAA